MRIRSFVIALVVAIVAAFPGAVRSAAPAGPPFVIPAILPLTGPGAFLGKAIAQSLGLLEKLENGRGGIAGRPVNFLVLDDQSNPSVAVQLFNEHKDVPVVLGSALVANCLAMAPLIGHTGPLDWCLSPGVYPPAGSLMFTSGVGIDDSLATYVRYFRLRGWTRVAAITATDASGQGVDHGVNRAMTLPENRDVTLVDAEHFNPTDLSVTAQIERIKAARPQVLIAWGTGTQFSTLLRGIRDVGLDIPIGGATSVMVYVQLTQYGDLMPKELYFPGPTSLSPQTIGPGPIRDAETAYLKIFHEIGVKPDIANNIVWDPALILVDALRKLGTDATPGQIHAYVENLQGWVGINGVYNFRDGSQRGIGERGAIVSRWNPATNDFVAVSRPGGYLK